MKLKKSRLQQAARVELLPLIDVVFLLLIFFIFVMLKMTMQSSIPVDLPALVKNQEQNNELVTITISSDNQIFINDQASSTDALLAQVTKLQSDIDSAILIRGDQQADLGLALSILDKLRSAGFVHVAFATEKKQQD